VLNVEVYNLYSLPNTEMMKSRELGYVGHVNCKGEMGNTWKLW